MTTNGRDERVRQAQEALRSLGFDAARFNERSALTLLALLDLPADQPWSNAGRPLLGVTPIMQWVAQHYGKTYAPNSRETFRRQTLHQFVDAALVNLNPDNPARPTNSGKNAYQIDLRALEVLRTFGTDSWPAELSAYLAERPGLIEAYAAAREQQLVPATLPDGSAIALSPGGQTDLIKAILEVFCPRWTPGGRVLYVGDTGRADPIYDAAGLVDLGIVLDKHGKLPDLVVYLPDRDWLVLMEAASSHGPVDAKRHEDLQRLFRDSRAGLVFVSCFPTRAEMRKYLADIAWETEVWCADAPSHLIHFNGERFLGPYTTSGDKTG